MTTNKWNVYKIFANGKVAKKPCHEFTCSDDDAVFTYFEQEIRPTLPTKLQKYKFELLKEGVEPAITSTSVSEEEQMARKRSKILHKHLKNNEKISDFGDFINFALLLSSETDWKWQWAAVERVTCKYLLGISPSFRSYDDAVHWVDSQM